MTSPTHAWVIRSDGVGAITLGRPLPEVIITQGLETRYIVRYVADAQPFEGFRFDAPPLTVLVDGGPFSQQVEAEGVIEPTAERYRMAAAKVARDGAKARAILVHGPGPVTNAGVGVGSRIQALGSAYPDLALHPVPPTLGGDECVAESAMLPNVRFVFPSCEAAKSGGPVLRIDIWP